MKGIKDLLARFSEGELTDEFGNCENVDEFAAKARELGYDVAPEEILEVTDLSDEDLDDVSGGFDSVIRPHIYRSC